jgi:hypothetical protein
MQVPPSGWPFCRLPGSQLSAKDDLAAKVETKAIIARGNVALFLVIVVSLPVGDLPPKAGEISAVFRFLRT